ncbi:MAG: heparan-alpha-glucosaminide N-acetyltransferase domain-containing protein [Bacteroidota bacterium]|nr:heparan-alpha-glucosaminide N-acetyltransferase domain-containing protein [Bacteroidota bacterium]
MNTLTTGRIKSIDLLRGLIMIIMALDHVRDYFHADAFKFDPLDYSKTTVILYFTRWITHFCAPIFVLLAGTSAFLSGQRKTKKELASFLVKRGIWLVILEETVVNFAWFFNFHFNFFLFGVIWVLGLSMIVLAGLIFLPRRIILIIGLVMVAGHNLLDNTRVPEHNAMGFFWGILHEQKFFAIGHTHIAEFYHLIPWAGVMALGYCLGSLFAKDFDPARRKRILLRLGTICLLLFVIVRGINVYGNLYPWSRQATPVLTLLSFLNISKYPPSLDYLLITEGFAFIFLAVTEHVENWLTKVISVYGRVPMFYYLCHIYLIHVTATVAAALTGFRWTDMTSFDTWISSMPNLRGYGFSLGVVYLIWICILVILYPFCKMYDRYKLKHKEKWWLSYL